MKLPILLFTTLSLSAVAQITPNQPHLSVNGIGEVFAKPDIVTISVSVNEQGDDVLKAKQQADKKLAKIINNLKEQGVKSKNIQASQVNINRTMRYNRKTQEQEFSGYTVQRQIKIKLTNIKSYPKTLQQLVALGVNDINNSTFGVSNYNELYNQAKENAFKDAKAKAKQLATGFNAKLGTVYSINSYEPNNTTRTPMPMLRSEASAAKFDVTDAYHVGDIKITASVNAVYYLNTSVNK